MRLQTHFFFLVLFVSLFFSQRNFAAHAELLPDGSTPTTTTRDTSGHVTVSIAPAQQDSISYNTYQHFNVPKDGVSLDNRQVNARTIVNEVTGTMPSHFEGELGVLGPKAHVILANPNGIVVDGGRFINTSRAVLSTGKVSFVDRAISPTHYQKNLVLENRSGHLSIEGQGLSGVFSEIDLLAKSIKLDGEIDLTNDEIHPSTVKIAVGSERAEFGSALEAGSHEGVWSEITPIHSDNPSSKKEIMFDVTHLGKVQAGSINIAVTDQGAGVRVSGGLIARDSDLQLHTDGTLEISGGSIQTKRHLDLQSHQLKINAVDDAEGHARGSLLQSGSQMHLGANLIEISGGWLESGVGDEGGDILLGDPKSEAPGSFYLHATSHSPLNLKTHGGGWGVYAQGKDVHIAGVDADIDGKIFMQAAAADVLSETRIHGLEFEGVFEKGIQIQASQILSDGNVYISAEKMALSGTENPQKYIPSKLQSHFGSVVLLADRAIEVLGSEISGRTQTNLEASDISVDVFRGKLIHPSRIAANEGNMVLRTTQGDIRNYGSFLYAAGGNNDRDNDQKSNALHLWAEGNVINRSLAPNTLAVIFSEKGDLTLEAKAKIINASARLISNHDLNIFAGGGFFNQAVSKNSLPRASELQHKKHHHHGWFRAKKTYRVAQHYDPLAIPGMLSWVIANGTIHIRSDQIVNLAGEIDANHGDVILDARRINNAGFLTGDLFLKRRCFIGCREKYISTIALQGGNIFAAGDVLLRAKERIQNIGGQIFSLKHLKLVASDVYSQGLTTYDFILRPRGLAAYLGRDRQGHWMREDRGGQILALGKLEMITTTPVRKNRSIISGKQGTYFSAGSISLGEALHQTMEKVKNIGLARSWLF